MKKDLKSGITIGLISVIFFIYSCGTPEERAIKISNADSTITNTSSASSSAPELHIVEIKDMKFQPASLSVKRGDTVMWINQDMVTHCVTDEDKKAWTSSNIATGASWKIIIKNNADYFCAIHQVMKGKITVE